MVRELAGEMGAGKAFLFAVEAHYASVGETADTKKILEKAEELAR